MKLLAPSRAASSLTLGMVLLVATTMFAQQLSETKSGDGKTAQTVAEMISRFHISQKPIDDQISTQLFDRYLEQLDGRKLYFTQADIDGLSGYRTQLDDLLKGGDISFAYRAFDIYTARAAERISMAQKFIDAEHDFSLNEELEVDAEKLPWAATEKEVSERWRKQIKYDLLALLLDDTSLSTARERLHKRYHTLSLAAAQTEDSEKLEWFLSALTHCFDPHSSYMSPQSREDFRISMELKLEGIGAALRSEDGYTIVANVVPGGAADKDGRLKKEDKIIGVDKGDGEMVDVVEMKLSKVVRMIRGKGGTIVRLKVKTPDKPDEKDPSKVIKGETNIYELTRQMIELTSSEVKGEIMQSGDRLKGVPSMRIGVINIPSFYRDFRGAQKGLDNFKSTARDVQNVLQDFRDKGGVDVVVIDLRMNGGGALSEAIEVSGLFIDQGPVVQVKEPGDEKETHDDVNPGVVYSGPLVVLCNKLSASASEIFAGVIKDYRRGIIVGDSSTHGKGTVQNVMNVGNKGIPFFAGEDRGALKLTISQFYRVNGDSTQNQGVHSDVVLPSLIDHMDLGEQSLDNALKFDHIPAADYQPLNMVTPQVISSLMQNSQARISKDPEFQKLAHEIDQYLTRKNKKTISLNLDDRRKEKLEDNKYKSKEEKLTSEDPTDGPIFPDTNYNNEVLRIGIDYAQLLHDMKTARN
ncbi:MAG: carboxy terminal-processing peptidase [Planctomycetaceae bacterium]